MGFGILLIGITDEEKRIIGFQETVDDLEQAIVNICRNAITPAIAPIVHAINLEKTIMVVEVAAAQNSPSRYKNVCYIRIGTTTRKASFTEETELAHRIESKTRQLDTTIGSPDTFKCDAPPINMKWVGRTTEIQQLSNPNLKVIFISEIGGQGKSGLASHYVKTVVDPGAEFEHWDWRDLKEEENRLKRQII